MILAGDIGGTNSRLAIFDERMQRVYEKEFKNAGRVSLEEIVLEFLDGKSWGVDRACFAVAGPVSEGKVYMTNVNWHLEEATLASELKIAKVGLINDLMGHAEGIELLPPDKLITLNAGRAARGGTRGVIAAGTGLGEAGLFYDNRIGKYRAFPTEAGHSDLSSRNELEDAVLKFLRPKWKHVFWELVLSGRGLRNLYDFYISTGQFAKKDELPDKPEYEGKGPTPADISAAAMNGSSAVAAAAMDLFVTFYGAEAGNMALRLLATGGVYLGGGIAPKIVAKLRQPRFFEAFCAKSVDKYKDLIANIPIHIIDFELSGLYGAANYASRL